MWGEGGGRSISYTIKINVKKCPFYWPQNHHKYKHFKSAAAQLSGCIINSGLAAVIRDGYFYIMIEVALFHLKVAHPILNWMSQPALNYN